MPLLIDDLAREKPSLVPKFFVDFHAVVRVRAVALFALGAFIIRLEVPIYVIDILFRSKAKRRFRGAPPGFQVYMRSR